MIGRTAGNLLDDQIIRSNLGSKAAPLRIYLAIQEVVWGRGLTPKILEIYRIKEVVGICGLRYFCSEAASWKSGLTV